jgi:hypothetical protein
MSQTQWILETLRKRPLTPLEALQGCGCLRLAARILDLKAQGHNIVREMVTDGEKTFARYRLARSK